MSKKIKEIYYTACPVEVLSHVAFHQGFFREAFQEEGTELRHISSMPEGEWDNHFTHRSPHFIRDGGNIPPIWTRSKGADTFAIGLTFAHRKQVLLTKRDSTSTVKDLAGKKIALPKRGDELIDFWRATLLRGSLSVLEINGLSEKDVAFVDISVSDRYLSKPQNGSIWAHRTNGETFHQQEFLALQNGLVDAVYTEGARVASLENYPDLKVFYTLSDHPDLLKKANICMPCVITASGELVREYPSVVQTYIDALVQAAKWLEMHREELINIWAKELYLPAKFVEDSFPDNVNEILMPRLDEESIKTLESQMNFLYRYGFIDQKFDLSEWIIDDFLKRATP